MVKFFRGDFVDIRIAYHQRGKDPLYKTWHTSKEHLFMYIYSGSGSIVSGEMIFPIKRGTLVFISANTYHYTMPDNPDIYDRSKLNISIEKFNMIGKVFEDNAVFKSFSNKAIVCAEIDEFDRNEVETIFDDMNRIKNETENELMWLSSYFKLLYFLDKHTVNSTSAVAGAMSRAIEYINENIANDIDIDDICSAVNISKHYFCRQFKKHTGMTVMKYILKTRIVLAKSDLRKSDISITETSEKYGFSSVSYFCRVFKEEEDCSPLKYRKKNPR